LVLCLFSLVAVFFSFLWARRIAGERAGLAAAVAAAVWFELVYFAPKAFTEVLAAHLLLPGLYFACFAAGRRPEWFRAGVWLGLALALRIHLAPAVGFATIYLCRRRWRDRWLPLAAGLLLPLLLFGLVDAFTWSYPFQSLWKNLWVNLVLAKSEQFGVAPWYRYATLLLGIWTWAAVPVLFLAAIGARRIPLLAWVAVIIVASHSAIGHKEYRFLYPILPLVCTLAGVGLAELAELAGSRWRRAALVLLLFAWTLTSALLAVRAAPLWEKYGGNLRAFSELSHTDSLCGVALANLTWSEAPGYTYLHRDVPIFLIERPQDVETRASQFNFVLTPRDKPLWPQGFDALWCWRGACLLRRPGGCQPAPGYHINRVLEERGQ
ncbi:MAG: hypothetical protein ACRD2R_08435, partial [Terriglobales bacterium]